MDYERLTAALLTDSAVVRSVANLLIDSLVWIRLRRAV